MKKILVFLVTILSCTKLMSNDISWSFPPEMLSTTGQNATDPRLVMDPNGNLVSVWVQNGVVKAKTKLLNAAWSSAVCLSGANSSTPRVVVDSNGNATAVWNENGVIRASSKPFGGGWGGSVAISSGAAASNPDLAVSVAGDVVAVWARNSDVESSTKLFGASWQTRVVINSTNAAFPRVAIGGSGANRRAVVVWHATSGTTSVVYNSTRLVASGSWSAPQPLSDTTHHASFPHVAMDANAIATAAWYRYDLAGTIYSNLVVQTSTRLGSGSWTPLVSLSAPGARNPADLSVSVGADAVGNTMAIWSTSFDGELFAIQSAYRPLRGDWTAATTLVDSNLYAYKTNMIVSSLGDALAGYMFYNGATLVIQALEADMSGFLPNTWTVPRNLSTGVQNGFPCVAAALKNDMLNTAAVWINSDGTYTMVQAVTGSRSVVAPPTSLSVTQQTNNFGVFKEYQNTVNWTASASPNVAGYLVFRNGVLVDQVDASTTQIVDHNMVQSGAVTYGVATVDDQQSQSRTVTVSFP